MLLYHYCLNKQNYKINKNKMGHIKINDETKIYFCGTEVYDHISRSKYAMSGYKLCRQCQAERDRLEAGEPTPSQVKNWWQGGKQEYERERELLK
jgi:hypothetical protein